MSRHLMHRLRTAKARRRADLTATNWLDQLGTPRLVKRTIDDVTVQRSHSPHSDHPALQRLDGRTDRPLGQ